MSVQQAMLASAEAARSADRSNRYGIPLALTRLLESCDEPTTPGIAFVQNELWQWRAEFGFYAEARQHLQRENNRQGRRDVAARDGIEIKDAVSLIVSESQDTRLVMVNEAHNVPLHRLLTIEVLRALRDEGFEYFAAEMLSSQLNLGANGYPVRDTGVYVREPLAAEMIKTAIGLGYELVAYEADFNPAAGRNWRDQGQAEKLAAVLNDNPRAKVVVHAGAGHIDEDPQRNWMGAIVQQLSGVDPLTIDQTMVRERRYSRDENPNYSLIARSITDERPVIPVAADGAFWLPDNPSMAVDMVVVHPRTTFRQGRPAWMTMYGARTLVSMPEEPCAAEAECIVSVWRAEDDSSDAVPVDQVEVLEGRRHPALALPHGRFEAESWSLTGEPIKRFAIDVR